MFDHDHDRNRGRGRGLCRRTLAGLALWAASTAVMAGDGTGFGNFPFGAQTTYAAIMPPAGTTSFFGYALLYKGDSIRDDDGNKIPNLDFELFALAPRLVHSWSKGLFGFKLSSGVVWEGLTAKVDAGPAGEDSDRGSTLIGIEPLYLTRSFADNTWHFLTGPLIYIKAGSFDRNALANSTLGHNSLAYQVSTTWTPSPRWEASLNLATEWKRQNDENGYRGGTAWGVTFGMGHRPFADTRWDLGFSGFYMDQFTDDEIDGQDIPGKVRTSKFAIGPKLVYWITPAAGIVTQYHREMNVHSGGDGDLFWVECVFPI
jgi:hypothetical protein